MDTVNRDEVWIFRIGSLGDALVSLPAVHSVSRKHPNSKLILLTNDSKGAATPASEILKCSGVFSSTLSYRKDSPLDMLRLIWILRARKPTHLYYLAPFRAQAQVARDQFFFGLLGGVKVIIGLDSKSSRATTHVQMLRVERESQRLLNVVDASCNVDDAVREKLLDIPDEAFRSTIRQLTEANWHQGQRIAAMTIGSKMQSKRWPIDRFIETAQMLLETYPDLFVVLLGNEEEAELASELAKAIPGKAINLSGRTSLLEAAAVLQLASFYIGNDTGTMHLAAAVGTPCVAVFSARDVPGKWEPYGRHHRVLRADVPCAGCMLEVCDKDLACLKGISSTAVMREIRQVEAFTANAPRTGTHEPDANQ